MQPKEKWIDKNSNYYIYTASTPAQNAFFYPICVGNFHYLPEYRLNRNHYDSFLLMYIKRGSCYIDVDSKIYEASAGQIVFLDCYHPHRYFTNSGWEALWIHFDGIAASEYFQLITGAKQFVFSLKNNYFFIKILTKIYDTFRLNNVVKEALMAQYITSLLTEIIICQNENSAVRTQANAIEEAVQYINEHLQEDLDLNTLASHVALSPFYFTRLFKKETGFTPHQYIIATRINNAKFLLKNTSLPIKEIAYKLGFSTESRFCTTFKTLETMTPSEYRSSRDHRFTLI